MQNDLKSVCLPQKLKFNKKLSRKWVNNRDLNPILRGDGSDTANWAKQSMQMKFLIEKNTHNPKGLYFI